MELPLSHAPTPQHTNIRLSPHTTCGSTLRYADLGIEVMSTSAEDGYHLEMRVRGIDKFANGDDVIQRQLFARSERVKGIDFHPTEPWVSPTDVFRDS